MTKFTFEEYFTPTVLDQSIIVSSYLCRYITAADEPTVFEGERKKKSGLESIFCIIILLRQIDDVCNSCIDI
jgi:hypothetical protein